MTTRRGAPQKQGHGGGEAEQALVRHNLVLLFVRHLGDDQGGGGRRRAGRRRRSRPPGAPGRRGGLGRRAHRLAPRARWPAIAKPPTNREWAAAGSVRETRAPVSAEPQNFARQMPAPTSFPGSVAALVADPLERAATPTLGSALGTVIRQSCPPRGGGEDERPQHGTRRNDVAGREHHDPLAQVTAFLPERPGIPEWASAQ